MSFEGRKLKDIPYVPDHISDEYKEELIKAALTRDGISTYAGAFPEHISDEYKEELFKAALTRDGIPMYDEE